MREISRRWIRIGHTITVYRKNAPPALPVQSKGKGRRRWPGRAISTSTLWRWSAAFANGSRRPRPRPRPRPRTRGGRPRVPVSPRATGVVGGDGGGGVSRPNNSTRAWRRDRLEQSGPRSTSGVAGSKPESQDTRPRCTGGGCLHL